MYHTREGDDSHMSPLAPRLSTVERHGIFNALVRNFAFHVVQQFMFNEEHGVWITYGSFEHTLGIIRRRRHHHFQSWNMRIPGLKHLGVLCAALRTTSARSAHDQRYLRLTAEHVTQLGRAIDEQITGKQAEINGHQLENGT